MKKFVAALTALLLLAPPTAYAQVTAPTKTHYITSAATTNSTNVKAEPGSVFDMTLVNTTATIYYLRMYNRAAAPTCSSATGFVETIPIPASATGAGVVRVFPNGRVYSVGIGYCLTGGGSSTDNTAAATGVYISIGYR